MTEVIDLGRRPLAPVLEAMRQHLEAVRHGAPGQVWLVEHEPVYTAGRSAADAMPDGPLPHPLIPVERGGRITFHGPGQLVVYPVVRLPRRDVRAWLRALEAFGIALCSAFGVAAHTSEDGSGVFAGGSKVGSIGVAIRHWINLHGLALNVDMDLQPFHAVRPCGLDPQIVSDLSRIAGRRITMADARAAVPDALATLLC